MTLVLSWRGAAAPAELVRHAARILGEGRLVALPTETTYALAAATPESARLLRRRAGVPDDHPLAVALRGHADAVPWLAESGPIARRLMRRCWPGPVTFDLGLTAAVAEDLRGAACPNGRVRLRSPGHSAFLQTLREFERPVLTACGPWREAGQVAAELGDDIGLIIDDGPVRVEGVTTVVRIDGDRWEVVREGVVSADMLKQVSAAVIVFVCTGNTCRSPLAEALCKRVLADRLGCETAELPRRGFVVLSAGVAVMMNLPAAEEAVRVAAACGGDLGDHLSQPLTQDLAEQADFLVAMTRSHLDLLLEAFPVLACSPRLLGPDGADVADPIGCGPEVYEACAGQIRAGVESLVKELIPA